MGMAVRRVLEFNALLFKVVIGLDEGRRSWRLEHISGKVPRGGGNLGREERRRGFERRPDCEAGLLLCRQAFDRASEQTRASGRSRWVQVADAMRFILRLPLVSQCVLPGCKGCKGRLGKKGCEAQNRGPPQQCKEPQ